jgi:hypothetical protein
MVIFMSAIVLLSSSHAFGQEWNLQVVDDSGNVGFYSDLEVLSDGTPCILYKGWHTGFYLAWWIESLPGEGGWRHTSLGSSSAEYAAGIDVDSEDNLHIAWVSYASGVYYGIFNVIAESWDFGPEWVASVSVDAHAAITVLQVEGETIPVVTYHRDGQTVHSVWRDPVTEGWIPEDLPATHRAYGPVSMIGDSEGRVHMSYYEPNGDDLIYAFKGSLQIPWGLQTVDLPGDVGQYSSIAVDDIGAIHIAYYDADNGDLKYATAPGP